MVAQFDRVESYVRAMYDEDPAREWVRLERHRMEYAVTMRALEDYLPAVPGRVLDAGGGPGRYAIELARQGYEVTLFDLSAACLAMAREKAADAGAALVAYEVGTATDLGRFEDDRFDAVLLMGPLYHLLDPGERRQCLAETVRVLRRGGVLFAAFITSYAVLRYVAAHDPTWPLDHPGEFEALREHGVLPPRGDRGAAFVASFAHPTDIAPLIEGAGLDLITVLGVEGLVSMIEEPVNALSGEAWRLWVDLNYRLAADPSIHGCVEHLLAVAVKA